MELVAFRAKNFRSLVDTGWIPIHNITIFTGQNDGGKTSLLQALDIFLNRKKQPELADYTYKVGSVEHETTIALEAIFAINDAEKEILSRTSRPEGDQLVVTRNYSTDKSEQYTYVGKVHPDPRLRRDLSILNHAELLTICDHYSIPLADRRTKVCAVQAIQNWLPIQTLQLGNPELVEEIISKFPQIQIFYSAESLNPEEQISSTLKVAFATKIKSEEYRGDITKITNKIEVDMKNELADLKPLIKNYSPGVEDVEIVPLFDFSSGFRTSKLQLKRKHGHLIDLERGGEGAKRRITLAVYDWRLKIVQKAKEETEGTQQLILAFDEPDTHLDYMSQRQIFDIIRKIAAQKGISVIVCTHSLNLIDRVPITDVIHFELKDNKTSINILETEDPELTDLFLYQISDNMGLKNSIMLNERCFLIVEGPTEMAALPVLFSKKYKMSPQAAGIRLLNGENNIGARLFAKFLHKKRRNVIFLVDNDVKNAPQGKHFTSESFAADGIDQNMQVHFIGKCEFEDAFTDEQFEHTANKCWPKFSGQTWSSSDFTKLRSEDDFSDSLLKLVRQQCKKNITKPQIGFDIARAISADEMPSEIVKCFDNAYKIANG